jgi:hypothetical protein
MNYADTVQHIIINHVTVDNSAYVCWSVQVGSEIHVYSESLVC